MSSMHRPRVGAALGLVLTAACSGSGNDNLGESLGSQDAATPEPDAAEGELDAGLGADAAEPTSEEPDAAAEVDAGQRGLVVRVRRGPSTAIADATVLLHDADGTLIGEPLSTDLSGEVRVDVAPESVTVLAPRPAPGVSANGSAEVMQLVTYTGVKPGDVLTVELALRGGNFDLGATSFYDVTLPSAAPTGMVGADLSDPSPLCATGATGPNPLDVPVQVLVAPDCTPMDVGPLVARGSDASSARYWYSWSSDLAVPPAQGHLAVTLDQPWVEATPKKLRFLNNPPNTNWVNWDLRMLLPDTRYVPARMLAYADAVANEVDFAVAPGLGSALHAQVEINEPFLIPPEQTTSRHAVVARRIAPSDAADIDIDYASVLDLAHSGLLGGNEPIRPTLSFVGPDELTGIDALLATVFFRHYDVTDGTFHSAQWSVLLPPGASEAALPELPAELAAYLAPSADQATQTTLYRNLGLSTLGDDVARDYDAFRVRPVRLTLPDTYAGELPLRPDVSDCTLFAMSTWWDPLD